MSGDIDINIDSDIVDNVRWLTSSEYCQRARVLDWIASPWAHLTPPQHYRKLLNLKVSTWTLRLHLRRGYTGQKTAAQMATYFSLRTHGNVRHPASVEQGRPVNVKHGARCVMGKVGGRQKHNKGEGGI